MDETLKQEVERLKSLVQDNRDAWEDDASLYQDMVHRINELELHLADEERKKKLGE